MPIEHFIGHTGRTFHQSALPMDDSFSHAYRASHRPCRSNTLSAMPIEHSIGYAGRSLPTTYTLSPAPSPCLNRQPTRADMCTDMCIDQCIDTHADIRWACAAPSENSRRDGPKEYRHAGVHARSIPSATPTPHATLPTRSVSVRAGLFFLSRPPQCVSLEPRCVQARRSPRRTPRFASHFF